MMCPNCNYDKSNITHSYHLNRGVKRERACKRCLFHFMTIESVIQQGVSTPEIFDALRKITNAQDLEEAVSIAYTALGHPSNHASYPFSNHIKK